MARRKARIPQGKKIQPAVKTLTFTVPTGDSTIDLSQCASLMNRRFYRQGLNWAVAGFTFFTAEGSLGSIGISKIPDTWVASNSWMKGFAHWQEMNNDAMEAAESVKPKFLDFKVFMDATHHSDGSAANLIPQDSLSNQATLGTWDMSEYVIPTWGDPGASKLREIIWVGPNYPGAGASGLDAVSLIEGYAASRGLPEIQDPNTPSDASNASGNTPQNWISAIESQGTDQVSDVLDNLISDNDNAPYPFENGKNSAGVTFTDTQYPGGANNLPGLEAHDVALVTSTTIGGKTTIRGGNFQGGLIRVTNNSGDDTATMLIHLVSGPHRGYMCQAMQDV